MTDVFLLAGAEADLLEHYSRYEDVHPGLGDRYYNRVQDGLRLVCDFPEIAPSYAKPFRRLLLAGFPVGVFYVIEGRRVVVHAMLDLRQSPKTIMHRLKGRLS